MKGMVTEMMYRFFTLEMQGDIVVATMVMKKLLDETNIQGFGQELLALADDYTKIVIDFKMAEYLSSGIMKKLIAMKQKIDASQKQWKICGIRPEIYEMFTDFEMDHTLGNIVATREEAIAQLR